MRHVQKKEYTVEHHISANPESNKTAQLYRMVMPKHLCPYGVRSKDLLRRKGYRIEDHWLTTREETDAFKERHHVKTTPQTYIDGERIGGFTELREHFGEAPKEHFYTAYQPIIAIFGTAFFMALTLTAASAATLEAAAMSLAMWFMGFALCFLAVQKLQNVESFINQFVGYDLLAQQRVVYAKVYPFVEALLGFGVLALVMSGSLPLWMMLPLAVAMLFMGVVGGVSVFKAVYVEKRELKCACVGGDSNVPLGLVSFMENAIMVLMGVYLVAQLMS